MSIAAAIAASAASVVLGVGAPAGAAPVVALPAHHCVTTGGAPACAGDPRNPYHEGEGRIAGADRYATSVAISQAAWAPGVNTVFIANGNGIDAIVAGTSFDAPVLLVPTGDNVPQVVLDEITRLAPTTSVIALGGEGAVSPNQLHQASIAAGFGQ